MRDITQLNLMVSIIIQCSLVKPDQSLGNLRKKNNQFGKIQWNPVRTSETQRSSNKPPINRGGLHPANTKEERNEGEAGAT